MTQKKSQIFMFDLIFSVVIIIVSLGILANYFTNTSYNVDISDLNNQILNGFTQTKINSLNGQEIRDMFINSQIKNIDNTVAQQVGEFYSEGKLDLAKNLTKIYVSDYVQKQMNFNLTLDGIELFSKINTQNNFQDSELISFSQRKIFGFINATNTYGPYIFQIRIWV